MANPKTGKVYVTNRAFKMTLSDVQCFNNCQRIMRHRAPRGSKNTVSMRDLVMKLLRVYEGQNLDLLRQLWAEDQLRKNKRKGYPDIVLPRN